MVGAVNDQIIMPKLIVIVPDNDIIQYIARIKAGFSRSVARMLDWLMKEHNRIIDSMKDHLPMKAKKNGYPQIMWIAPPYHVGFGKRNNDKRECFNKMLEEVAKTHSDTSVLHLKKVWEPENNNLFLKEQYRYTTKGLKTYWEAVDRTVKFCDTTILRRVTKQEFKNSQYNRYKWTKPKTTNKDVKEH